MSLVFGVVRYILGHVVHFMFLGLISYI